MKCIVFAMLLLFFCSFPAMAKTLLIDKIPVGHNIVALTLEDTGNGQSLADILEICRQERVRITLFCSGETMKNKRKSIEALLSLGCEVGICGVKYQSWEELRPEEIRREVELSKAMLPKVARQGNLAIRPPYDNYTDNVLSALSGTDKIFVVRGTSVDCAFTAGSIINIKINDANSLRILQDTITRLKRQGYQIAPVLNLLKKQVDN